MFTEKKHPSGYELYVEGPVLALKECGSACRDFVDYAEMVGAREALELVSIWLENEISLRQNADRIERRANLRRANLRLVK